MPRSMKVWLNLEEFLIGIELYIVVLEHSTNTNLTNEYLIRICFFSLNWILSEPAKDFQFVNLSRKLIWIFFNINIILPVKDF